jgi:hypothetical protein
MEASPLPFVIPSEAEGSAVLRTIPGNVFRQRNHGPFGPPKVMKNAVSPATVLHGSVAPPLCHPERSRGICSSTDHSWKCFSTEESWAKGDEKRRQSSHRSSWKRRPSPLSSRAKPRDLQFYGPFLEMFFDTAWKREHSGAHPGIGSLSRFVQDTNCCPPSIS